MIPTLLLAGLVFGKWWRVSIPAATIGWAVLLLATGIVSDLAHFAGAASLGFINVTVGVLVFQAVRAAFRGVSANQRHAAHP
ncbi:MAG TPA: hypothetical protein VMR89_02910 [Actinomycetota bacterium]|nr:hypothetical protein [Actinomycetota bacterium]